MISQLSGRGFVARYAGGMGRDDCAAFFRDRRVAGFVRRHGNEYWIGVVNGEDGPDG